MATENVCGTSKHFPGYERKRPVTCQFDSSLCQMIVPVRRTGSKFKVFSVWCAFCFATTVVRNPVLIRKSMKLIKEITEILREIISSGDEERLRQLQQIVRAFNDSRQPMGSRALH